MKKTIVALFLLSIFALSIPVYAAPNHIALTYTPAKTGDEVTAEVTAEVASESPSTTTPEETSFLEDNGTVMLIAAFIIIAMFLIVLL